MTKTIHRLLFHYSSTKWGGRGADSRGGTYLTFRLIGGTLIQGFTVHVYLTLNAKLNLHEVPRDLLQKVTFPILRLALLTKGTCIRVN